MRNNRGRIIILHQSAAPAKDSDSYDFDAIEKEIIHEQSLQPNNKSITTNRRKKSRKGSKRGNKGTLPTQRTAKTTTATSKNNNRKRKSRRSYGIAGADLVEMPPWLTQYEDDNLEALEGTGFYLPGESQPSTTANNDNDYQLERLRFALNGIFYHVPTSNTDISSNSEPYAIPYFTPSEIHEVMDSIRVASHGNKNLINGCAEFLYLMLTLEEEGVLTSDLLSNEAWDDDDIGTHNDDDVWDDSSGRRSSQQPAPHSIMTRDVLVAAAFHYCDCVRARKAGVYDYARHAMDASLDTRLMQEVENKKQLWLAPVTEVDSSKRNLKQEDSLGNAKRTSVVEDGKPVLAGSTKRASKRDLPPLLQYGDESHQIAAGAARLKRAEIMSSIVKSKDGQSSRRDGGQRNGDAEILRSFLVSLSEDWRALVIRSSACLYRLKGVVEEIEYSPDGARSSARSVMLSATAINTARDAFRVYAPLAQRLGMQRLKTELENTAFRILYPRQYSVASSLYNGDIDEMKTIVRVLSSRIEQILRSDQVFADQIEDVTVSSRVKEPYSLWKKLLRYRKEIADTVRDSSEKSGGDHKQFAPSTLSLKWVPDTIALRVVLRGLRLSPLEDDESLRTREKMLCYYALQLISNIWPASARNHAKDYIKNPKPNGYQSLHYTASLMVSGEEWPFEVQIRSDDMHRIAEFGVAAHWDYKLQNKLTKSLPDNSFPSPNDTPLLALPPAGNTAVPTETQLIAVESNTTETADALSRSNQKGRVASHIEALTTSRETLVQNNKFIFLSSTKSGGRIVSIDPSACHVADVLEQFGISVNEGTIDDISDGTLEIFQNGVSTSLDEELSNGDVLTLPESIIWKINV